MAIQNSKGQLTYQLDIDKQQVNGFPIPCDFYSTGKIGVIYPTQALEVNYGNKIENTSSAAVQFNPLAVPIMANMYEKQEHYYTPYIDVWDNFDNFISGGEDGTFNTPPPSFTFYQLMSKLNTLFGISLDFRRYHNISSIDSLFDGSFQLDGTEFVYLKLPSSSSLDVQFASQTYGFFAGNGLLDIRDNFIKNKLDKIVKSINDISLEADRIRFSSNITSSGVYLSSDGRFIFDVSSGRPPITYVLFMCSKDAQVINTSVNPYSFFNLVDVEVKNKYYEDLRETIIYYESLYEYNNSLKEMFFSDFGYSYFLNYYGMYKPFCGVGSYVDCLNLGRFTETDFYLMFMVGYLKALKNNSTDWILAQEVCSEMPKSALVLRVQYLIWYNNYRDQLLETQALKPRKTDDITDEELIILTIPRVRCWQKDSYTTALDNPATADAVVPSFNPIHSSVTTAYQDSIQGKGVDELKRNDGTVTSVKFADGDTLHIPNGLLSGYVNNVAKEESSTTTYISLHMLDAVRRAQSFMRKALFYGNRIQDFIYTTYGVAYLDSRLRLPEILSASSVVCELNTLVNNTTTAESVAGDRTGYAKAWDDGKHFVRYCEEAGVIMSFFTIMPEQTYAYGSDRKYSRFDRYDFPIPDFATLGMDAVFDFELTDTAVKVALDNASKVSEYPFVFGYQGRYYDSKFRQSTEHGELLTTQDMYTFARKWNMYNESSRPKLNYEFVHCFPALDMFVMEDGTEDYFRFNVHHETMAHLALPYHSIYMS